MRRPRVLITDDDLAFSAKLESALTGLFEVEICRSEAEFRGRYAVGRYDLLMMDMRLHTQREGLDLLKEVLARDPGQAAIMMTAYADTETYGDAIAAGALTYVDKSEFSPALIARTVEAIVAQGTLKRRLSAVERRLRLSEPEEMIGVSPRIKAVGEQLRRAAEDGDLPILIVGEPGSGRQLAARIIHRLSRRRGEGPFVVAACDGTDPNPSGASLFGVSSPGSRLVGQSPGCVDEAMGGLLVVNGLSGLDPKGMTRLGLFLETGRFSRIGDATLLDGDAQVVILIRSAESALTLANEIRNAIARRGGLEVQIPPLRERREDIPLIAQYVLQKFVRLGRTRARSLRAAALVALESQPWPGNVRELVSAIEYAAVRADSTGSREIGAEHLPLAAIEGARTSVADAASLDYQVHLARAELGLVESVIERFDLTAKSVLAERLRYNDRYTFSRRIRKCFLHYPSLRAEFPLTAALYGDRASSEADEPGQTGTKPRRRGAA